MSDNTNFQEFSLYSSLFKGRKDLYYCYLKSEKIAQVLTALSGHVPDGSLHELLHTASGLPSMVLDVAAGDVGNAMVLAEMLRALSSIRMLVMRGVLARDTGAIISSEYEALCRRLDGSAHPSPFVAAEDFIVPALDGEPTPLLGASGATAAQSVKDISKGHATMLIKGHSHTDRSQVILDFIRQKQVVSIKDICQIPEDSIRSCSEKTIQRELGELIRRGLIKKVGERRWSHYEPL